MQMRRRNPSLLMHHTHVDWWRKMTQSRPHPTCGRRRGESLSVMWRKHSKSNYNIQNELNKKQNNQLKWKKKGEKKQYNTYNTKNNRNKKKNTQNKQKRKNRTKHKLHNAHNTRHRRDKQEQARPANLISYVRMIAHLLWGSTRITAGCAKEFLPSLNSSFSKWCSERTTSSSTLGA